MLWTYKEQKLKILGLKIPATWKLTYIKMTNLSPRIGIKESWNHYYFPGRSIEIIDFFRQTQIKFGIKNNSQFCCFFPFKKIEYLREKQIIVWLFLPPFFLFGPPQTWGRRPEPWRKCLVLQWSWGRSAGVTALRTCPLGIITTSVFLAGPTRTCDTLTTSKRLRQLLLTKAGFFSE